MAVSTLFVEAIRTNFIVLHKLIRAQKLEMVSHLAASVSHEVRNPLTVSRGFHSITRRRSLSRNKERIYSNRTE